MLAAIAVMTADPDSQIPETLNEARYVQIIELEDGSTQYGQAVSREDDVLQLITEHGCRALICGQISPPVRQSLREKDVLCFDGYLYQAQQVRRLLYTGVLPGIK